MDDVRRLEALQESRHLDEQALVTRSPEKYQVGWTRQSSHGLRASSEVPTTRVFAHVTAETQVALGDAFAPKRNPLAGQSDTMRTHANPDNNAFLEVFPRSSSRQPRLLQQLELLLQDKLHQGEKMASPYGPGHRDPAIAANLRLHAHRSVWEAFINGFGTYKPFMASIKHEYDTALHNALVASAENVSMRLELAAAEERRAESIEQAKIDVTQSSAGVMLELHNRLVATEDRAVNAERRAQTAETEAQTARDAAERVRGEVQKHKAIYQRMLERKEAEERWKSKPEAKNMAAIEIGPMDDDKELGNENSETASS